MFRLVQLFWCLLDITFCRFLKANYSPLTKISPNLTFILTKFLGNHEYKDNSVLDGENGEEKDGAETEGKGNEEGEGDGEGEEEEEEDGEKDEDEETNGVLPISVSLSLILISISLF